MNESSIEILETKCQIHICGQCISYVFSFALFCALFGYYYTSVVNLAFILERRTVIFNLQRQSFGKSRSVRRAVENPQYVYPYAAVWYRCA